jgi:hypothetical protein
LDNVAFNASLLLIINSVWSTLVQLGVDEQEEMIDEETEWPVFVNNTIASLVKQYLILKVKQTFDPSASEALNRTLSSTIQELEGRLTHEIEETNDVA